MSDLLLNERDMDFMLYDWLGVEDVLASNGGDATGDDIRAYMDLSRKVAEDLFLPHYKDTDNHEPYLDKGSVRVLPDMAEAVRKYAGLGFFGASFSPEHGGMGLPFVVTSASYSWAAAAGPGVGFAMLTGANARLITRFGNAAQIAQFAAPEIEGTCLGTMCLSEPQAGSGLGDIRTKAVADGEDTYGQRYLLSGNKMWISGGDQDITENIIHLVLAKVPNADGTLPTGTGGISLFIVPKILPDGTRNDVAVAGLNHKMGNRGISNCLLNFGESGGATGWMVGDPGQGLRQMFMMMNEARIAVGFGAAALACRGYLLAAEYAKERTQGRVAGQKDDLPVPIIQHSDVKRMLLAARSFAEGSMALCLYSAKLVDQADDPEALALLELLTPITKTFPSEFGPKANDLAIQVHGGYGYTRDFDVEQLYRDNRLNPIHEGTTGIQAADLLGRKILRSDGSGLQALDRRISETTLKARQIDNLKPQAENLASAAQDLKATLAAVFALKPGTHLDNAAQFQEGFGRIVVAWLWLDKVVSLQDRPEADTYAAGKRATCRYFFECELPLAKPNLAFVATGSDVVSKVATDLF